MALDGSDYEGNLETVASALAHDVRQAVDFIESEFEAGRARAQRYWNGESDLAHEENHSKYVATLVRDVIRQVRPSMMRVLASSPTPVEFVPATVAQAMVAEQQSIWINQLYEDLGGYKILYDVMHDAMLKKLGVAKYWWDDSEDPIFRTYSNLTEEQVTMLTSHPSVELLSGEEKTTLVPGPQGIIEVTVFDVEVVGRKLSGSINMEAVPLNEFIISRNARSLGDARVVGHRRNMVKGDLVAMGFEMDKLEGLNSDNGEANAFTSESFAKRGYIVDNKDGSSEDETMDEVLITEVYYRADLEGIGIPQLYRFWLGGTGYELLDYERAEGRPFALFSIDPEPGTVWGKSLYDVVNQEQDAITSITRGSIDSLHMSLNPRMAVHENLVNMEDVLNNDFGAPIRVKASGQLQVISTPYAGGQALPLLNHLQQDVESKTGVTRAAAGLDPDAMQSTDKDAVRNTIQAALGQVEFMARNLAETGMKDLFRGLLELSLQNMDPEQLLRMEGRYVPVKLDAFDPTMGMRVAVGVGTGSHDERLQMLGEIFVAQKEVIQTYGPGNPIVSMQQMQTTLADRAKMMGVNNIGRYFNMVTPQVEQQLAQQQQEKAEADAKMKAQTATAVSQAQTAGLVESEKVKAAAALQIADGRARAELMKAKGREQIDLTKIAAQGAESRSQLEQEASSDFRELMVKDDFNRDELLQELYIAVMKMQTDMAKADMSAVTQVEAAQRAN